MKSELIQTRLVILTFTEEEAILLRGLVQNPPSIHEPQVVSKLRNDIFEALNKEKLTCPK